MFESKQKQQHRAFRFEYSGLVRYIITPVFIFLPSVVTSGPIESEKNHFKAIWDTGATNSVITQKVVQALSLVPIGKTTVCGVNSQEVVDTYLIDIGLPNKVLFQNVVVSLARLNTNDMEVLIGMDIILRGDFLFTNLNGKSIFNFAFPPFKNNDNYVEKATEINRKNHL